MTRSEDAMDLVSLALSLAGNDQPRALATLLAATCLVGGMSSTPRQTVVEHLLDADEAVRLATALTRRAAA